MFVHERFVRAHLSVHGFVHLFIRGQVVVQATHALQRWKEPPFAIDKGVYAEVAVPSAPEGESKQPLKVEKRDIRDYVRLFSLCQPLIEEKKAYCD